MSGRFIAVVGPSGVGKDSLIAELIAADPRMTTVRRVITREADAGGENHVAVSRPLFAARAAGGDFALHWQAHGLCYGIPAEVRDLLRRGQDVLVNVSRGVLQQAADVFDGFLVLHVTAEPDVLARRLHGRGRENRAEIARRLARQVADLPDALPIVEIDNSGTLTDSVGQALSALYPERV